MKAKISPIFLSITKAFLIAFSIYFCLIKSKAKKTFYSPITSNMVNQEKLINKCIVDMKSKDQLKEINIKNRTCYYFDDIIRIKDFVLDKILIDGKHFIEDFN